VFRDYGLKESAMLTDLERVELALRRVSQRCEKDGHHEISRALWDVADEIIDLERQRREQLETEGLR
jgi:hypothetical protein